MLTEALGIPIEEMSLDLRWEQLCVSIHCAPRMEKLDIAIDFKPDQSDPKGADAAVRQHPVGIDTRLGKKLVCSDTGQPQLASSSRHGRGKRNMRFR